MKDALLLGSVLTVIFACTACASEHETGILITNARIIDGAGNPWYRGNLLVRGDRIEAVGPKIEDAKVGRVIDASGRVVCPGFIDVHNHCEKGLLKFPDAQQVVRQGVTTLVGGPCGGSVVDMGATLSKLDSVPLGPNVCLLAGFNSIRSRCMKGSSARPATEEEIKKICELMEKAMKEGAVGMSTGLKYAPFTETAEVIAAAKVVARYGGVHMSHIREEGRGVVEAVAELIRISEESGVPGDISHHKVMGLDVQGESVTTLRMVDEARARGLDITLDQYPYAASSTGLSVLFPTWAKSQSAKTVAARYADDPAYRKKLRQAIVDIMIHDRAAEDPAKIVLASCAFDPSLNGKSLRQILEERQTPPTTANAADLVVEFHQRGGVSCVYHNMDEADVERIMRHPACMVGSDGTVLEYGKGVPHPRGYGTFPRILGLYVREKGVLKLEEAIRKMTSYSAQRMNLLDRGLLRPGMMADIVIFDPDRIIDRATFTNPHQYPDGIEYVIVNGCLVVERGGMTDQRPGRALRGPGA
ncbi:MAG: D-aminoacylase [Sedimentisphaerales bacterium]|nr:D-aminoacylase [Sedimentisphaerales bacterium]